MNLRPLNKKIYKILKFFLNPIDFVILLLYNKTTKIKKGWKLKMKVIVKLLLKFMIKVLLPLGIFASVVDGLAEMLSKMGEE